MEFLKDIIGADGVQHFFSLMLFALIGATINLLNNVSKRDKASTATPVKFSFWFMVADNWKRCVSSLLLVYLFVRFMPLLLPSQFYDAINGDIEFLLAIIIGFSFDKLSEFLKDKAKILSVNREEITGENN
ncbi:MAG: hypothetical protein BGO32_08590 [Bacteroidetes bacterium 37-13]|nr:MAG: hypothetical protein BGO32_08590 [Bacteroidetes bacterium 37-13]